MDLAAAELDRVLRGQDGPRHRGRRQHRQRAGAAALPAGRDGLLRRLLLLDCGGDPALRRPPPDASAPWASGRCPCWRRCATSRRMASCFAAERPDVVLHAAALKHVAMCEAHPLEALATNAWAPPARRPGRASTGWRTSPSCPPTRRWRRPASWAPRSAPRRPTCSRWPPGSTTRFAAVRFGNVLGSNGSVLPLFHEQISRGGPVTVTDPRRDPLLHDHPRGLRPDPAGHAHRPGRRDLHPRHGRAGARPRRGPQPDPPLRLRARQGHRGEDHRACGRARSSTRAWWTTAKRRSRPARPSCCGCAAGLAARRRCRELMAGTGGGASTAATRTKAHARSCAPSCPTFAGPRARRRHGRGGRPAVPQVAS